MVSQKITRQDQQASQQAHQVLNYYGKSFAFARYFLAAPFNQRATDLYAICRWIDDLADEIPEVAYKNSDNNQALQQSQIRLNLLTHLQEQVNDYRHYLLLGDGTPLNGEALSSLLEGVINDLTATVDKKPRIITDQDDLLDYCYQVAGSVGLLMCNIFEVSDPKAYPHAIALGMAMQLTNIARDFYEDLDDNRRYIPSSWLPTLGTIGLDKKRFKSAASIKEINQARIRMIDLADQYYQYGIDGIAYLPKHSQVAIQMAALIYRGIGIKLKKQIQEKPNKRFRVNLFGKLWIALSFKLSFHNAYNPEMISTRPFCQNQRLTPGVQASLNRFLTLSSSIDYQLLTNKKASDLYRLDIDQFVNNDDGSCIELNQMDLPKLACHLYWFKPNNEQTQKESSSQVTAEIESLA